MAKLGSRTRLRYTGDKASAEALRDEWKARSTRERVYRIIKDHQTGEYGVAAYLPN